MALARSCPETTVMPVAPCGEEMLSFLYTETGHMADKGDHFPGTVLSRHFIVHEK